MASKSLQLLLSALLSLTLVLGPSAACVVPVNLKPVKFPTLVGIAKFAVSEYNKEFNKDLILKKVIKGDFTQGYNDRIYRVYIRVTSRKDILDSGVYVTFVQVDPSKHRRDLIAFHQLSQ